MKKTTIAVFLIVASIASFLLGGNLATKGVAKSVDRMQAELSFGHLRVYENIQSDILSGCISRAESRLESIIDEQKMSMAEYVQSTRNEEFENYINTRDSNLIQELLSYEVNWKKTWTLPDCQPTEKVTERNENKKDK